MSQILVPLFTGVILGACFIAAWRAIANAMRARLPKRPVGYQSRRMTEARRFFIFESLDLFRSSWESMGPEVKGDAATGNAAVLYMQIKQLDQWLDEVLRDHLIVAPTVRPEDAAPTKALRARYRAEAGAAFGKPREKADPNDG